MSRIAAHTLGCKVNQYDTQAMLELFQQRGWTVVPFSGEADVYLINTCTVTGAGDKKSLQLIRKIRREHPSARLIICGCMAQQRGADLLETQADLILGTQNRAHVVELLQQAEREGPVCAVDPLDDNCVFEPLRVSQHEHRTRAVMKIQEGCRNNCSYCIIPSVRGPIRSRLPEDICCEAHHLVSAGFREIVLTGIHLSSYGRDLSPALSLTDPIQILQQIEGLLRIRLGSLEPMIASESFVTFLKGADKICPQFHLALQSGSNTVLARMRRQYTTEQYLRAVERLRAAFPHAAFTTDVLTGFPGETDAEFEETASMIQKVGFARIHVFPFSPRPGTPAASMPGQLPSAVKEDRTRRLIALGHTVANQYLHSWVGRRSIVLPEEKTEGCWEGYTPEYIRVRLSQQAQCVPGVPVEVMLSGVESRFMSGEIV